MLKYKIPQIVTLTLSNHSTTIINYFEERLTNASAESFNAKIKAFRSQLRGVADGNSSCSDWLGYTLKRKLANRENPLTRYYFIGCRFNNRRYDMGPISPHVSEYI